MNLEPKLETGLTYAFIRDEASGEDFFGSHDRVADAIATVIRKNADLKVIGLLGAWGSGKSTVVKLVRKQLESDSGDLKTFCFTYDAWMHQNDPPRRSFLETLIYYLIEEKDQNGHKLTSEEKWRERLAQLNGQIENTETISTPGLTRSGRWIVFSLFLLPLGLEFVGYDWAHAAFGHTHSAGALVAFLAGAICLVLPALLASIIYFSWRPTLSPLKKGFRKWSNWSTHRPPFEQDSILSLFMSKGVRKLSNRLIRSADPTAIEFQDIFREIMEAVASPKRRFLFVIDNLDRLPEAEAVAMWGTIRGFFLGAHQTNHVRKTTQLPTIILPIDESAVRRMYAVAHKDEAEELARSFVNKTFDLTFRVTPPVLSDWSAYLAKQMRAVFGPNMPGEWPYVTGRLYEKYVESQSTTPNPAVVTPRTINTLINNIATLWLQWQGSDIAFASVAYFAIYRDYNAGDIARATATPLAGINELDADWQRAIAALHYGVDPENAVQVLIEQRLRNAISEKDKAAFAEISKVRGYEQVFQRIVDQSATVDGLDYNIVVGAAILLESLNPEANIWIAYAWRTLRSMLRKTGPWRAFSADESKALEAFVSRCEKPELEQLVAAIGFTLAGLDEAVILTPTFSKCFIDVWRNAFVALRANKLTLPRIQIPGNAEAFLTIAVACQDDGEMLKRLDSKTPDPEIMTQVVGDLQNQGRNDNAVPGLTALLALGRPMPWDTLIAAAGQIVQDQNANNPAMTPSLSCLGLLRPTVAPAKARLQQLVAGGQLLTRLNEAHSANNDPVAARAMALLILMKPDFAVPEAGAWDSRLTARPALPQLIDDALRQYDAGDNFDYLIETATSHPGLAQIVRAVISRRVAARQLGPISVPSVVAQIEQYLSLINSASQLHFIQQLAESDMFWGEVGKLPFETGVMSILRMLIADGSGQQEQARRALEERLDLVPAETWNAALASGTEPYPLAATLATTTSLNMGPQLFQTLENAIGNIVTGEGAQLRSRWFEMANFLGPNARHTLFRNVRDKMVGETITALIDVLRAAPDSFFADGKFSDRPDGAVRHIVIPTLASADGIQWLATAASTLAGWIKGSDATTQRFLVEQLSELWSAGDESKRVNLESLQKAWGLPDLPVEIAETPDANADVSAAEEPEG